MTTIDIIISVLSIFSSIAIITIAIIFIETYIQEQRDKKAAANRQPKEYTITLKAPNILPQTIQGYDDNFVEGFLIIYGKDDYAVAAYPANEIQYFVVNDTNKFSNGLSTED